MNFIIHQMMQLQKVFYSDRNRPGELFTRSAIKQDRLALALKDLGFVAALTGSLMGSLIIYIFPALFRLKSLKNIEKRLSFTEKASTYGLIGFGSILGVVGVAVSVLKQFTSVLG